MRLALATIAALALCALAPAPAAPAAAPPDLSGFFSRIGDLWFDAIEGDTDGKPVDRLNVDSPDAEDIWAGDSANPILQPWARDIVKRNAESEMRLQHVYTADDSCWPSGVPQAVNLLDVVQFIPTKDRVTILYQRNHQVRRIWLNVPHSRNPKPSWYGESVGHYDGDTLVVDTIGLKAHKMSVVDAFGTPHTEKLHVVERYRPYATPFGKRLEVIVRVEDSGAFIGPWKGMAEYQQEKTVKQFEETVCAENNRDFGEGTTFGTIPQENAPQF
ncbi:MAG TPA: hypothetical protein VNH44_12375 [Micropepsaceae bacterium]|nr:hypothetical protein [Micropepsaceae bacterium]